MNHPVARELGQTLELQRSQLAEAIVARQYEWQPELLARYGPAGRAKCVQDTEYHLRYLATALSLEEPSLFTNQMEWSRILLEGYGVPTGDLLDSLECMRQILLPLVPAENGAKLADYLEAGRQQLLGPLRVLPSYLEPPDVSEPPAVEPVHNSRTLAPSSPLLPEAPAASTATLSLTRTYLPTLLQAGRHEASQLIVEAVAAGTSLQDIYLYVLQPSQYEVGRLWQMRQITVAQEHYCTAATQFVMTQLYPYLFRRAAERPRRGRGLVGLCISGELHEVGLRMICDVFETNGWDTHFLGANMPAFGLVQMLQERQADVLAISATMTFHLGLVRDLITTVRQVPETRHIKILVGGYPCNLAPAIWQKIGADGYASNIQGAVSVAEELIAH